MWRGSSFSNEGAATEQPPSPLSSCFHLGAPPGLVHSLLGILLTMMNFKVNAEFEGGDGCKKKRNDSFRKRVYFTQMSLEQTPACCSSFTCFCGAADILQPHLASLKI